MDATPTKISPELTNAVCDLVNWWQDVIDGNEPGLFELVRCVHFIKGARPFPAGLLADDLNHIVKPPHNSTRSDHIDVLERLRDVARVAQD